jgi:regulator of replication initiation timing
MNFIHPFSEVFVAEQQEQPLKELVETKPDPVATAFETINEAHSKKHTRKKRKLNNSKAQPVESTTKGSVKKTIDPNNLLKLNREELSGLSSQEFEEYVRQLTAQRELTAEELKELKRQRRLIKNRESAHASRQRKKNYVEALEAQVASLATENANLKERITSLSTENTKLKEEVCFHFQIFCCFQQVNFSKISQLIL